MKSTKIEKALLECLTLAYKESTPPADLDELMKSGEGKQEGFFMKYYLDTKRQQEIINQVAKKYRLRAWEKHTLSVNYWLGGSPTSNKT